mmetsp:Transcript_23456/g.36058  ORF Transcript_23456/g.36058 Transcript_23456/m.36058 type:complete len:107 (+) Transcript_23456:1964-2284(+)
MYLLRFRNKNTSPVIVVVLLDAMSYSMHPSLLVNFNCFSASESFHLKKLSSHTNVRMVQCLFKKEEEALAFQVVIHAEEEILRMLQEEGGAAMIQVEVGALEVVPD